jgi:hypothetical protein
MLERPFEFVLGIVVVNSRIMVEIYFLPTVGIVLGHIYRS